MSAMLLSNVCHGDAMEMKPQSLRLVDDCDSLTKSVGSGRRKRSKPTRVYLDADATTEGGNDASEKKIVGGAFTIEGTFVDDEARVKVERMEVDDPNSFACDMCSDFFATHGALVAHIESVHNIGRKGATGDNNGNEPAAVKVELFPTKYHKLGSEFLQQQASISPTAMATTDSPVDLAVESKLPREIAIGENGELPTLWDNGSKSRIFHPDAYCEICDREFCNKYFLKTHKANKHGIYDAPTGDGSSNGGYPVTVPPYGGDVAPFPASVAVDVVDRSLEMPPVVSLSQPPMDVATVSCASPYLENATLDKVAATTAAAMKAVIQNKMMSTPCSTVERTDSTASSIVSTPISTSRKSSPNMEDYCDICQKHFCNKYYLKKHRHDVHGIVTEVPGSSAHKRGRPLLSAMGGMPVASMGLNTGFGSLGGSMMPSLAPILLPPPITMATSAMNGNNPVPGMSTMANIMFLNPFAPPMALIQGQPQALLQTASFPPLTSLPQLMQPQPLITSSASDQKPAVHEATIKLSGAASNIGGDRHRGGIPNSDTYCELCCKEFCDQYFLRIHKANKHGVYYSDMPLPAPADVGLGMPLPLTKPPPPAEQMKPRPETEDKLDAVKSLASSPVLPPNPMEAQNAVSSHLSNMHKMMSVGLDLSSTSEAKFNNGSGTMFSNMVAAKFASRVMCDLCNKEVCNKYFLKTHKIKVHGIDPALVDLDAPFKSGSATSSAASTPSKTREAPELMPPLVAQELPPQQPQVPQLPQPLQQRPRDDELLKLGIDPEAYCEICKKEFCSKYFLKTHKGNIHGIKGDNSLGMGAGSNTMVPPGLIPLMGSNTMVPPMGSNTMVPLMSSNTMVLPMGSNTMVPPMGSNTMVPSMLDLPTLAAAMPPAVLSMPAVPSTSPTLMPPAVTQQSMIENAIWSTMTRKSPSNSTRITCGLCNKELCNKYFLKTHLLNMHGLVYDLMTGLTSTSTVPLSDAASTPLCMTTPVLVAPAPSKMPGQADEPSIIPLNMIKTEQQIPVNMIKTETVSAASDAAADGRQPDGGVVVSAKTWSVPGEQPSVAVLKAAQNDAQGQQGYTQELCVQKCEICGMIFGEKVTLHLHMIHDHQDRVTVCATGTPPAATTSGVAATVRSRLHSLVSLRRKYHHHQHVPPRRKLHAGKLKRLAVCGIGDNVKSAIVNHIRNNLCQRKKFRCVHCQERFGSRLQCQTHIRSDHGITRKQQCGGAEPSDSDPKQHSTLTPAMNHDEAMDVTSMNTNSVVEADKACPTVDSQSDVAVDGFVDSKPSGVVLQPFTMEETTSSQNHFTKSLVHLPVYHKIVSPLTVTVTLTPTMTMQ